MKKLKSIILMTFFICTFYIFTSVYAGNASADKINIEANINKDGSVSVTETIKWDIEERLNGVYRDILIKNPSNLLNSAENIAVHEVSVDGKMFEFSNSKLSNGASGKYNINNIDNGVQVKIFAPSKDEKITTVIKYTLYDVVVKYNDVAEFYWNFIGSEWDFGIDDVNIVITLPGKSNIFKIYGHGPLEGNSSIISETKAVFSVNRLRSSEQVDTRILLDRELIETSKVEKVDKLEEILQKEGQLAIEANAKRESAKKMLYATIVIVVITTIIPIVVYIVAKKKKDKPEFNGKYFRELVKDYGPAVMNKVLYPATNTGSQNNMLATLLDLTRKKYVEIEPLKKENGKKPYDYNLKLINKDYSSLNAVEEHFIKNLIFKNSDEITLKDLKRENTKNYTVQEDAYKKYKCWEDIITKEAKKQKVIKDKKIGIGRYIICLVISLIVAILTFAIGIANEFGDVVVIALFGVVIQIIELATVSSSLTNIYMLTKEGLEHQVKWKAFKKFLQDFSKLGEKPFESLVLWEHYLVYAAGLGIAKEVIKQLEIVYPTEFTDSSDMFTTYATFRILSDGNSFNEFSNSFTSAAGTAFSSPSSNGSGGGFSGGAGGGGGRWRWRWILIRGEDKKLVH